MIAVVELLVHLSQREQLNLVPVLRSRVASPCHGPFRAFVVVGSNSP